MATEKNRGTEKKAQSGFSLVELCVTLAVMLVIASIAVPSIMQGWSAYRLTSAADSVAGLLQRARFEAIHENTSLSVIGVASGGGFAFAIDENGNGVIDLGEPQVQLPGPATLINPGIAPGPASMGAAYAGAIIPPGNSLTFDARGTVVGGATYIAYFGIPNQPKYGFRAVTITSMGQVKTWQASANSTWIAQ